jgi:hypothetical protein
VRTAVGSLIIVILLLTCGEVVRRAAIFEDALAATQEHLATQDPADTPAPEDDARGVQLLASLPVIGRPIRADLLRQRALAAYWRGDYSGVDLLARRSSESEAGSGPRNGTNPEPDGQPADDVTRFIAANALFRDLARQPGNREAVVRGLDAVLKAYASVLGINPNAVDAAYNYEFVSRLRSTIAAGRSNSIKLPSNSNVHGEKGAPPTETKPGEFNIIVPLNPQERQDQIDPRAGAVPQRKG